MNKSIQLPSYFWILLTSFFLISILTHIYIYLSWDISWLLEASRRLLNGGSYTQNFFESNPPLILYLYAIPVLLSYLFGSLVFSFNLFVYLIALCSLCLSYQLLKRLSQINSATLVMTLLSLSFAELILPNADFGQREHLCFMLITPYLFLNALRLQKHTLTMALLMLIGLMAGIGFSIKPHFVIPLVFVLSWQSYRQHSFKIWFKPENCCIYFVMLLYLIAIYLINPDYYSVIIPAAYQFYLKYPHSSLKFLILDKSVLFIFLAITLNLWQLSQQKNAYQAIYEILIIANLGFLLIYFLQGQAWFYHLLPCLSLALVSSALSICHQSQIIMCTKTKIKLYKSIINLCLSLLVLMVIITFGLLLNLFYIDRSTSPAYSINQILQAVKSINQGPYMVLTTGMEPGSSLLTYSGLHSSNRMENFWILVGIINLETDGKPKALSRAQKGRHLLKEIIIQDLQRDPPYIILVDENQYKQYLLNTSFDYLVFLNEDPRFRAFWKNYRFKQSVAHYAIYIRNQGAVSNAK